MHTKAKCRSEQTQFRNVHTSYFRIKGEFHNIVINTISFEPFPRMIFFFLL